MRRRAFIKLLGAATAASPLVARAQPSAVPVIGFLTIVSPNATPVLPLFRQGLAEVGYVEGRNVAVEYRYAEFHPERLPALASDLVMARVALIVAASGVPAVLAAKAGKGGSGRLRYV
jgi:putative tryptophan/tyrosine transport system substrate-binding protein